MCQTQESDLKVFQMETQAWHAPLEKLKQVLQQEILHSVCWGTVLINNGYSLAFNWISSPFTIWCSLLIFRRYFSHEEPQHFAVTVPRTSLLALGPDKLLLNACLYYSRARQKLTILINKKLDAPRKTECSSHAKYFKWYSEYLQASKLNLPQWTSGKRFSLIFCRKAGTVVFKISISALYEVPGIQLEAVTDDTFMS